MCMEIPNRYCHNFFKTIERKTDGAAEVAMGIATVVVAVVSVYFLRFAVVSLLTNGNVVPFNIFTVIYFQPVLQVAILGIVAASLLIVSTNIASRALSDRVFTIDNA